MSELWKTTYSIKEIEIVPCPLCSSAQYTKKAEEWSLGIVRCNECGLYYVNPRLKDPEKNYWGEKDAALPKYEKIFSGEVTHPRDKNYREHARTLKKFKPSGRLLDIGSYLGFFLNTARDQGWELFGIEPAPNCAALSREKYHLNIHNGYLADGIYQTDFFDIVTIIDVLEHTANPLQMLGVLKNILKPDGILFIKVPNIKWNFLKYRIVRQLLKKHEGWDIFDSREHIIQYDQKSLEKMLVRAGFRAKQFYSPRPVQSMKQWKNAGRMISWTSARIINALTGILCMLSTDIACIACKA
jgi:SAM-dependent methyltransferase